jgi:universal stress protein E
VNTYANLPGSTAPAVSIASVPESLRNVRIDLDARHRQRSASEITSSGAKAMRPIRRILVAVKDPGATTLAGVAKAAQLARAFDAELTVFQALRPASSLKADASCPGEGPSDLDRCTAEGQQRSMQTIARRLRRRGIVVSVSNLVEHPAYTAILREAARVHADLIVAEAHPRSHHAAGLLRLTDWELLQHSPVPVLLVKQPHPYRRPKVLVALDPDHTFGKPERLDADVLAAGAAITQALHGTLHAVHAYAPVPPSVVARGSSPAAIDDVRRQSEAMAAEKLAIAVRGAKVARAQQHVVGRHVPDAIEEVAIRSRISLVVMGAIARTGLTRLLIGNTAERVLDHLSCDVLVVKPSARVSRRRSASHRGQASVLQADPGS